MTAAVSMQQLAMCALVCVSYIDGFFTVSGDVYVCLIMVYR